MVAKLFGLQHKYYNTQREVQNWIRKRKKGEEKLKREKKMRKRERDVKSGRNLGVFIAMSQMIFRLKTKSTYLRDYVTKSHTSRCDVVLNIIFRIYASNILFSVIKCIQISN